MNAELSARRLEKLVRREGRALVYEARDALKRAGTTLGERIRSEVSMACADLDSALKEGDHPASKTALANLDRLAEEHLADVRKSSTREYIESIGIAVAIAMVLRLFVVEAFKIPSGSMIPTMEIGDHIFVNKFIYGLRLPFTNKKYFTFRQPKPGEVIVFVNPCEPDKDFIKRVVAVAGDTVEVRCAALYVNGELVEYELVDEFCTYEDRSEPPENQWSERTCSRYQEVHGSEKYMTVHGPGRPRRERDRQAGDSYAEHQDSNDFPDLGPPSCSRVYDHPDPRSDQERLASIGRIEPSKPESTAYPGPCAPQRRYVVPDGHVFVMGDNRENSSDSRRWGPVPFDHIKGKALFIWYSQGPDGLRWERLGEPVH